MSNKNYNGKGYYNSYVKNESADEKEPVVVDEAKAFESEEKAVVEESKRPTSTMAKIILICKEYVVVQSEKFGNITVFKDKLADDIELEVGKEIEIAL